MSTVHTPKFSLHGKTAIVTGAGQGIGKAIATAFAAAGANVAIADIKEEIGTKTAAEIQEATSSDGKENAIFIRTDVTKSESIRAMVEATVAKWGRLDIAVNNAGLVPEFTPISEMDEDRWNHIISVNLTGVALSLKWETQQMIRQGSGGSIINITSSATKKPGANAAAYNSSKYGVIGLTKTGALENAKNGIRVNAVGPGGTRTEMVGQAMDANKMTDEEFLKALGVPLNRYADPSEIAQAVLWLALDCSSFVTGTVLEADGGYGLV